MIRFPICWGLPISFLHFRTSIEKVEIFDVIEIS